MQDADPKALNVLKESEAHSRASQISNVKYNLSLTLTQGSEQYKSSLKLTFDVSNLKEKENIFLDFVGHTIDELSINDQSISNDSKLFKGNRIHLKDHVKEGSNTVAVKYTNNYDHSGDGFHQFVDPKDKNEYVYTNFEPFDCHRLLPCFDQPNIKGEFTLSVEAPSSWKVMANSKQSKSEEKDGKTLHHFNTTPRISTYLFAVVAGPYDSIEDNYDNRIPLGLYVRKSLRKYLDNERIFTQTKQGMKFYEEFFDYKYPFEKYDQIFCPEFNIGAMENVGCVTFTEHYIFKDPPTRTQVANRADTILHEMAHMWFGNLVSPVWWDGLWLNESFATYMAGLCTAEATEFGGLSWQNFNSVMKEWAYREDQLSTTHPIQGQVIDTEATFLNFDGITYGKGASLLKQLVYVVGLDGFKAGLKYYFKKYAWGNTTITQFLEAIEHATSGSFHAKEWAKEWLETAGLNTLHLKLHSSNGKVDEAVVLQKAPSEHPTLRCHHTEVVVFDFHDSKLKVRDSFKLVVNPTAETKIDKLVGQPTPSFVYLNYNDHCYAKCLLDSVSQEFVLHNIEKIENSLLRQLLWSSLYTLTRDAEMKSTDFLGLVSKSITFETDPKLVSTILQRALSSIHFVPDRLYFEKCDELFDTLYAQIPSAKEDFKIIWARYSVATATSEKKVKILLEQLKENNPALTQDMRWNILQKAASWNLEGVEELLEKEKERDKSDVGQRAVLTAKTSFPKEEVKAAAWERYLDKDSKLSAHQLAADMSGFLWHHQRDLLKPYKQKYFQVVRSIFADRPKEYSESFGHSLFPSEPEDPSVLQHVNDLLKQLTDESSEKHLRRFLKESIDDINRSMKCRNLVGL